MDGKMKEVWAQLERWEIGCHFLKEVFLTLPPFQTVFCRIINYQKGILRFLLLFFSINHQNQRFPHPRLMATPWMLLPENPTPTVDNPVDVSQRSRENKTLPLYTTAPPLVCPQSKSAEWYSEKLSQKKVDRFHPNLVLQPVLPFNCSSNHQEHQQQLNFNFSRVLMRDNFKFLNYSFFPSLGEQEVKLCHSLAKRMCKQVTVFGHTTKNDKDRTLLWDGGSRCL